MKRRIAAKIIKKMASGITKYNNNRCRKMIALVGKQHARDKIVAGLEPKLKPLFLRFSREVLCDDF